MLDVIFSFGQVVSALIVLYGAVLVLMPAEDARTRATRHEMDAMHLA